MDKTIKSLHSRIELDEETYNDMIRINPWHINLPCKTKQVMLDWNENICEYNSEQSSGKYVGRCVIEVYQDYLLSNLPTLTDLNFLPFKYPRR